MTEATRREDDQIRIARYRVLAREVTDPLAAGLLNDIVMELEARSPECASQQPISGHLNVEGQGTARR